MICRGNSRSNATQLANYLMDRKGNDYVEILEAPFLQHPHDGEALQTALKNFEKMALAGSQSGKKALFHAQISPQPPYDREMTEEQWRRSVDILEEKLGLQGHERVFVLQEKKNRKHLHIVWNRKIPHQNKWQEMSFSHLKNMEAQKVMEQEFGHPHTPSRLFDPLDDLTRSKDMQEMQQDINAEADIRNLIIDAWQESDMGESFIAALEDKGLILARGDRRNYVVLDHTGSPHSLTRRLRGVANKEAIDKRLNHLKNALPSVLEAKKPEHVIFTLSKRDSVFTKTQLQKALLARGFDMSHLRELEEKGIIIKIKDGDGKEYYTSATTREEEKALLTHADNLAAKQQHHLQEVHIKNALESRTMDEEQEEAFKYAMEDNSSLKIIEGRAGSGKSYTMGAIREAYQNAGYDVMGLAPTNSVVADMQQDGFDNSRTVHSQLYGAKNGLEGGELSEKNVVIIDEAAMIGTSNMKALLEQAERAGAKVILIGDRKQLDSVERGGMFSIMADRTGYKEITKVRRQETNWEKAASESMASGRFEEALNLYNENKRLHWQADKELAHKALVKQWEQDTKDGIGKRFVFAYTNNEVDTINQNLREVCIKRGDVAQEGVKVKSGSKNIELAVGDRVQFRANDKPNGVINGTLASVSGIKGGNIHFKTDDEKIVIYHKKDLPRLNYGYAGTIYRGQGKTLDETYAMYGRNWKDKSSYVAMTRSKKGTHLFVAKTEAKTVQHLAGKMQQKASLGASLDYRLSDLNPQQASKNFNHTAKNRVKNKDHKEEFNKESKAGKTLYERMMEQNRARQRQHDLER